MGRIDPARARGRAGSGPRAAAPLPALVPRAGVPRGVQLEPVAAPPPGPARRGGAGTAPDRRHLRGRVLPAGRRALGPDRGRTIRSLDHRGDRAADPGGGEPAADGAGNGPARARPLHPAQPDRAASGLRGEPGSGRRARLPGLPAAPLGPQELRAAGARAARRGGRSDRGDAGRSVRGGDRRVGLGRARRVVSRGGPLARRPGGSAGGARRARGSGRARRPGRRRRRPAPARSGVRGEDRGGGGGDRPPPADARDAQRRAASPTTASADAPAGTASPRAGR